MGNGGSACDAHMSPWNSSIRLSRSGVRCRRSICEPDTALTAISNDQTSKIFVDQLDAGVSRGTWRWPSRPAAIPQSDLCVGGGARNGLLTIAFAGKDGGRIREVADHCFTVPSFSIHRIQESHVTLLHIFWDLVHVAWARRM